MIDYTKNALGWDIEFGNTNIDVATWEAVRSFSFAGPNVTERNVESALPEFCASDKTAQYLNGPYTDLDVCVDDFIAEAEAQEDAKLGMYALKSGANVGSLLPHQRLVLFFLRSWGTGAFEYTNPNTQQAELGLSLTCHSCHFAPEAHEYADGTKAVVIRNTPANPNISLAHSMASPENASDMVDYLLAYEKTTHLNDTILNDRQGSAVAAQLRQLREEAYSLNTTSVLHPDNLKDSFENDYWSGMKLRNSASVLAMSVAFNKPTTCDTMAGGIALMGPTNSGSMSNSGADACVVGSDDTLMGVDPSDIEDALNAARNAADGTDNPTTLKGWSGEAFAAGGKHHNAFRDAVKLVIENDMVNGLYNHHEYGDSWGGASWLKPFSTSYWNVLYGMDQMDGDGRQTAAGPYLMAATSLASTYFLTVGATILTDFGFKAENGLTAMQNLLKELPVDQVAENALVSERSFFDGKTLTGNLRSDTIGRQFMNLKYDGFDPDIVTPEEAGSNYDLTHADLTNAKAGIKRVCITCHQSAGTSYIEPDWEQITNVYCDIDGVFAEPTVSNPSTYTSAATKAFDAQHKVYGASMKPAMLDISNKVEKDYSTQYVTNTKELKKEPGVRTIIPTASQPPYGYSSFGAFMDVCSQIPGSCPTGDAHSIKYAAISPRFDVANFAFGVKADPVSEEDYVFAFTGTIPEQRQKALAQEKADGQIYAEFLGYSDPHNGANHKGAMAGLTDDERVAIFKVLTSAALKTGRVVVDGVSRNINWATKLIDGQLYDDAKNKFCENPDTDSGMGTDDESIDSSAIDTPAY